MADFAKLQSVEMQDFFWITVKEQIPLKGRSTVRFQSWVIVVAFALVASMGWAQEWPYEEDFSAFTLGVYNVGPIDAAGNWNVESGTAAIQQAIRVSPPQALEIGPQASVNAPRDGVEDQIIWLQGQYRTAPQASDPDVSGLGESSALMYFNSTQGIMVYNGTTNAWEAIDPTMQINANTWYLITIMLDFDEKTWDIYVNSELKQTGIGFKDPIANYNGFRCRSSDLASGYLDDFYLSNEPPDNITPPPTATPTPTLTPTPTTTPTATATPPPVPTPSYTGPEFFLYSVYWQQTREMNETPYNETFFMLNRFDDEIVDWLDIYKYIEEMRGLPTGP